MLQLKVLESIREKEEQKSQLTLVLVLWAINNITKCEKKFDDINHLQVIIDINIAHTEVNNIKTTVFDRKLLCEPKIAKAS